MSKRISFSWNPDEIIEVDNVNHVRQLMTDQQQQIIKWAKHQPYPDARKIDTGFELRSDADFKLAEQNNKRAVVLKYVLAAIDREPHYRINWYDSALTITDQHIRGAIIAQVHDD